MKNVDYKVNYEYEEEVLERFFLWDRIGVVNVWVVMIDMELKVIF